MVREMRVLFHGGLRLAFSQIDVFLNEKSLIITVAIIVVYTNKIYKS